MAGGPAVTLALMAGGSLAVFGAWRVVARGRISVWAGLGAVSGGAGIAALITGRPSLSPRLGWGWAGLAGVGIGAALYLATVAFVILVRRWPAFAEQVAEVYDQRKGLSIGAALLVAAGVTAPGEELFWRGLFQARLADPVGWAWSALATWGAYVLANAASQSLPILAAAVVSGAVWGALALWTHGVLASVLCHVLWTGLMVAVPPDRWARSVGRPAERASLRPLA